LKEIKDDEVVEGGTLLRMLEEEKAESDDMKKWDNV